MPYYIDEKSELHFLEENDSATHVLPGGCKALTDAEALALIAAKSPSKDLLHNEGVLLEIDKLEKSITPRRVREALISMDYSFMEGVEAQIKALRATLIVSALVPNAAVTATPTDVLNEKP